MARSSKAKKKAGAPKKRARAKAAAPAARKAKPARRGESDDSSESLRAIAKSFAARLLR